MLDFINKHEKADIPDCSWPWFVTTLSWNTFDYCCFSGKNGVKSIDKYTEFESYNDVWNSKEFIKVREHIVKNQTKKICTKDCPYLNMERSQSLWRNDKLIMKALIDNPNSEHRQRAWDNYLKAKEAFLNKKTVLDNKPVIFDINTGSACNLKCKFCYHHSMKYEPDRDCVLKYIDDVKDSIALGWVMGGEPLVTKLGREIFKKFSTGEYTFMTGFVTNGQIFDYDLLSPVPISQVTISTDAAKTSTYESIRINGSFEKLINNIKAYVKMRDEEKPYMYIDTNYTITSDNYKEIPEAINLYEGLGIDMVFHLVLRDKKDPQNILYRKDLKKDFLNILDKSINLTTNEWTKDKLITVQNMVNR